VGKSLDVRGTPESLGKPPDVRGTPESLGKPLDVRGTPAYSAIFVFALQYIWGVMSLRIKPVQRHCRSKYSIV
jgi:hypothetical protein